MSNKKTVLFLTWSLSRGGAQKVVYNLIKNLPKNFTPSILFFKKDESMKEDFESIGVKVCFFDSRGLRRKYKLFRSSINQIRPDIVHSHLGPEGFFIYIFLKLIGVKKIYNTFHLGLYPDAPFYWFTQFFIDRYFLVTKESYKKHSKKYHILPFKQEVIYNGVEVDYIKNVTSNAPNLGWPEGTHILSIANLLPLKGYEYALPAIENLMKKHYDLHYHICGGPVYTESTTEWINDFLAKSKFRDRIHLHGQVKNVYPYCKSADIFFSASEAELLPMALLEAMYTGLPAVFTDVGGVPEVLGEKGEYGVLIPPKNVGAAVEALDKLISDKNLREEYSKRSKKRAEDFDISKTFVNYYRWYEK